jgi:DNA-binding response OmpR family regulator
MAEPEAGDALRPHAAPATQVVATTERAQVAVTLSPGGAFAVRLRQHSGDPWHVVAEGDIARWTIVPKAPPARALMEEATFGPISIHPALHRVLVDGVRVELARKQFDVLRYLAGSSPWFVTEEELVRRVWGRDPESVERATVHATVSRLRGHLADAGCRPNPIVTIHGVGWRLVAHEEWDVA